MSNSFRRTLELSTELLPELLNHADHQPVHQSLIAPDKFQHILRLANTNIEGKRKVMFALTSIKGIGRRFSNLICKKADIDLDKRAGELSEEEIERIMTIINNPRQFKIPDWFLNRQRDPKDGKFSQVYSNFLDNKFREDMERLKVGFTRLSLRSFRFAVCESPFWNRIRITIAILN